MQSEALDDVSIVAAVHVTVGSEGDGSSNADVESGGVNGSDREDESAAELFRREQQSDATLQRAWKTPKPERKGLSVVVVYFTTKRSCWSVGFIASTTEKVAARKFCG
ncbi:hypothetical protein HPB50_009699 [Hyalomma asiaticum]|uniref:Uncharacterized protein n=1 Tax=Hyalomma asiaticum TaxID=266040 RepID=A0ACB7THL0_HYAAI|nr:hypothetical protein HPB50_009699 [Hyalomma asiaticum]